LWLKTNQTLSQKCYILETSLTEVCFIFPIQGDSTHSTNPNYRYTAAGYSAFVASIIQELGITDCVFVGWSLGGHLMLESFQREAAFRQAAKAIIIHGTPPITTESDVLEGFIWTDPAQIYFSTANVTRPQATVAVMAFFRPGVAEHPGPYAPIIANWTQQFLDTDGIARYIVNHNPFGDEVNTVENLLAESDTPIAILHGREDRLINATYTQTLVPHIPTLWEGAIHFVESAGHALFWERPGVYNDLLHRYMEQFFHH
jgi:pimeloyl-ACP methyl ester carboxylesterase